MVGSWGDSWVGGLRLMMKKIDRVYDGISKATSRGTRKGQMGARRVVAICLVVIKGFFSNG